MCFCYLRIHVTFFNNGFQGGVFGVCCFWVAGFGFCWFVLLLSWWLVLLACCSYLLLLRVLYACHPWRFSMPFHGTTSHFSNGAKSNQKRLSPIFCPAGCLRQFSKSCQRRVGAPWMARKALPHRMCDQRGPV